MNVKIGLIPDRFNLQLLQLCLCLKIANIVLASIVICRFEGFSGFYKVAELVTIHKNTWYKEICKVEFIFKALVFFIQQFSSLNYEILTNEG